MRSRNRWLPLLIMISVVLGSIPFTATPALALPQDTIDYGSPGNADCNADWTYTSDNGYWECWVGPKGSEGALTARADCTAIGYYGAPYTGWWCYIYASPVEATRYADPTASSEEIIGAGPKTGGEVTSTETRTIVCVGVASGTWPFQSNQSVSDQAFAACQADFELAKQDLINSISSDPSVIRITLTCTNRDGLGEIRTDTTGGVWWRPAISATARGQQSCLVTIVRRA